MALVAAITKQYYDGKKVHVIGTITASGSYTTGGDTLSLTGLNIKSSQVPYWLEVQGVNGFNYAYVVGATQATGKVKVFVLQAAATNTPLAEHTAAAYVAGVTGDTITFYAEFEIR